MMAMAHFAGLVITTIFAAAAAVVLDWLFLQAMFRLMRPAGAATSQRGPLQSPTTWHANATPTFRSELVNGTRELVRQFGPAAVRR
jgi:hypothetical protein